MQISPPVLKDSSYDLQECTLHARFRVQGVGGGGLGSANPETLWLQGPEAEPGFKARRHGSKRFQASVLYLVGHGEGLVCSLLTLHKATKA